MNLKVVCFSDGIARMTQKQVYRALADVGVDYSKMDKLFPCRPYDKLSCHVGRQLNNWGVQILKEVKNRQARGFDETAFMKISNTPENRHILDLMIKLELYNKQDAHKGAYLYEIPFIAGYCKYHGLPFPVKELKPENYLMLAYQPRLEICKKGYKGVGPLGKPPEKQTVSVNQELKKELLNSAYEIVRLLEEEINE